MQHQPIVPADLPPGPARAEAAEAWMVAYLADLFDIPAAEVDVDQPFDEYGLDSAALVAFTSDLGRWLGRELDLRLLLDHPTIRSVAAQIRAG